jgi:hypothetical protein
MIILLEISDKCKNDQNTTSQEVRGSKLTIQGRPNPLEEVGKMT